jgi:hypothetical protein
MITHKHNINLMLHQQDEEEETKEKKAHPLNSALKKRMKLFSRLAPFHRCVSCQPDVETIESYQQFRDDDFVVHDV